ncbi:MULTISPECIES: CbrC family protein [unclassified Shewanella]|uniref:CbrC family protein n=1 Tax=unclassified Shewanella TaxID=196818 RepID=UPI002004AE78|nr:MULTISPECIES: CbrC family protein [unclassified Shewanella]MCK7633214.1 CbrC family protein [Shewanella sp. JNE17]MCK7648439.1 CbrC family protein [Shewanella sp. JNE8]MCK7656520.1 CbrC family protein [Shewanella sp. JNE4-2]UPO29557.1 CbrC family protein [Shewanella sp. JNE2]
MELPKFKYHPNPINTGSIVKSGEVCKCCNKKRGFIYKGSMYTRHRPEYICPWCIANGEAREKFEIEFSSIMPAVIDPKNPISINCPDSAFEELLYRTPGFSSYQEIEWPNHCEDFCVFHGVATIGDIQKISKEEEERLYKTTWMDEGELRSCQNGNPEEELHYFFKFVCLKCGEIMLQVDPD